MKSIFSYLRSSDFVTILFLLFLTTLHCIFFSDISQWYLWVIANIFFIGGIICLTFFTKPTSPIFLQIIRSWYLVPTILYCFKQTYFMVSPIRKIDYDAQLIAIDRWIFGTDITVWITQFSHPIITEFLQLSYSSYYIFFLVLFFELYKKKMWNEFYFGSFLIVYGFYLSYVGYFFVPAVGPRFTLHDFQLLNQELPGLWFTNFLRDFINAGGSIPNGVTDAIRYVQRDAFPSGHTQLTLTAMYLAFTYKLSIRWGLLIVGSLLIISTIYLRYHYGIDVIGGIVFFLLTIWSGKKVDAWWRKKSALENIA